MRMKSKRKEELTSEQAQIKLALKTLEKGFVKFHLRSRLWPNRKALDHAISIVDDFISYVSKNIN